jgi:hypothetical protein
MATAKQINFTLRRCKYAVHGKTSKALRRKEKMELKKNV